MKINSIKKILNLISNLNFEEGTMNYDIRKIDYCYELTINDYIIYFEDIPYEKVKYLEINHKLGNNLNIKLSESESEIIYFRLIFRLLLTNYLRNRWIQDKLKN